MRTSLLLTVATLSLGGICQGQTPKQKCEAPSASVTTSVTDYVQKKYHLPAGHAALRESPTANEGCYWKYNFEAVSPKREIVLYLAPDHRFLTPTLFDSTSDPLAEEKTQRDELNKQLLSNKSANRGPEKATVTIVEFSDFECPYCQRFANILEKEVLPGDPDIRVVFKNFPLPMHPWARAAAQEIACAGLQSNDAFWSLHDYAFSNQRALTVENVEERLATFADQQSSIDHKAFHECVDRGLSMGPVTKDEELGHKLGVSGTPTVFINGSRVPGIKDAAQVKDLVAAARAGQLPFVPAAPIQGSGTPRNVASASAAKCEVPAARGSGNDN